MVEPGTQGHTPSAWHHRDSGPSHSFLGPVFFPRLGASRLGHGPPSRSFQAPHFQQISRLAPASCWISQHPRGSYGCRRAVAGGTEGLCCWRMATFPHVFRLQLGTWPRRWGSDGGAGEPGCCTPREEMGPGGARPDCRLSPSLTKPGRRSSHWVPLTLSAPH